MSYSGPSLGLLLFCLGLSLGGCASIVEGTEQSVRISLSPKKAICTVTREGAQVASVSRANPYIKVSKSKNDLEIECRAPDHISEHLTVESSASGWGVVGCVFIDLCITDYSTGALNKYPEEITVALVPQNFKSEQERDSWFENRRKSVETDWNRRIEKKALACDTSNDKTLCKEEQSDLEKRKTTALKRLEDQRLAITIKPGEAKPTSIESRLDTLKRLYDRGKISQQEYEAKRKEIMSGI